MRVHVPHKIIVGVSLLVGGLALACSSDDSGPSTPRPVIAKTAANNGDAQTAMVAQALALPLQVVVTLSGAPQVGTTVVWATTSGAVTPGGPTDANGVATATWTLGNVSGAVTATAAVSGATGSPVTFDATADPDVADELSIAGGNGQTGSLNTALPPLQAKVADQFGNGVPGVDVDWEVTSGAGSVAPASSTTNAGGIASATVTLGGVAGDMTVDATAAVPNGSPQTFTETAAALPLAVTVSVNSNNFTPKNPVIGVTGTVTWNWVGSGHSVTDDPAAPSFTDHDALQSAGFVFGPIQFNTAGSYGYHCSAHGSPGAGMSGTIVVQ